MTQPAEYNSSELDIELTDLRNRLNKMDQYLSLVATATAPLDPVEGWVAISDGTSSGFDASSGAGMYRWSGSAWVFVG